jgi:hypothetical protein
MVQRSKLPLGEAHVCANAQRVAPLSILRALRDLLFNLASP